MHEELIPDLHRIELPLPKNPLRSINCYLIKASDRFLLIDTGMHLDICHDVLKQSLEELNVDLDKTDFYITHFHSDHIGQLRNFARSHSKVYFNPHEAEMVTNASQIGGFRKYITRLGKMSGFSEDQLQGTLSGHPGGEWKGPEFTGFELIDEGDTFAFGEFNFDVLHTPGHSPGHLCLYERERKLMVCGDHVLEEISPNISPFTYDDNPLGEFIDSLHKVNDFEVEMALPGHRRVIHDFSKRVDELVHHHDERLDEVMRVTDATPMTAYEVAAQMTWDMKYDTWESVNVMQRWFAAGEATAHLRYLMSKGKIGSELEDGVIRYWAT